MVVGVLKLTEDKVFQQFISKCKFQLTSRFYKVELGLKFTF